MSSVMCEEIKKLAKYSWCVQEIIFLKVVEEHSLYLIIFIINPLGKQTLVYKAHSHASHLQKYHGHWQLLYTLHFGKL